MTALLKNASYQEREIQLVISDDRHDTGWITCVIAGRWVQAKVYDEPSTFGVNDGRVSKLCIDKSAMRDPEQNFFAQMDYNYDRGLDFSNLSEEDVNVIVETLEKLPKQGE